MPVPRRVAQCDRLVGQSLPAKIGEVWRRHRKYIDRDKVVFQIEFAASAKAIAKYKIRYENEIERVTGYRLEIDWEFISWQNDGGKRERFTSDRGVKVSP